MPKSITIDPKVMRARGALRSREVPVNYYKPNTKTELKKYGKSNLVRMYRDMVYIREFETMLSKIKRNGSYQGIHCTHHGPLHLSIGQEAAVVGQAYHLDIDDFIFGTHRSHGEILAKCFSTIEKRQNNELFGMMSHYMDGIPLRVIETHMPTADIKDLSINYVLYAVLAEIFGRSTGMNQGMGGSMHAFFPPFGIMPNNAIAGGSAPLAAGSALYKRVNRQTGIVIANIGDGAMGSGPVWEAMLFSAMDQYKNLWRKDLGGGLPIIFNFMNNFYGMSGQPVGETMSFGVLARVGLAINSETMHTERVDGYNPIAVADAIERKRAVIEAGRGPVMLDTITYRYSGHQATDATNYRDKREEEMWQEQDSIQEFRQYLIDNEYAPEMLLDEVQPDIERRLKKILQLVVDDEISTRVDGQFIESVMFSNVDIGSMDDRQPEVLKSINDTRLSDIQRKQRSGLDTRGNLYPAGRSVTYAEAIFEAVIHRFYEDPSMIAYGEENRAGGAFGVYKGLPEALPYHRLFSTPISEAAVVGSAIGYALTGGRVVAELMSADFIGRAGDEILNQMAKWQGMSGGLVILPVVLRVSIGMNAGAQLSQDLTSLVAQIPGLKVYYPATPYDAKGMLNLALRGTDPVVFFESQRLYEQTETLVEGGVPTDYYEVDEGVPVVCRDGDDLTIITSGAVLYRALEAADELYNQYGISAEVIDLRFINPLDYTPLVESIKKTGRAIVASDSPERGSYMHTIASNLTQLAFRHLDGPIPVLGSRNWIVPLAELEDLYFPQKEWFIDAIHERLMPLPDYEVRTVQTTDEILRRNRMGV